MKYQANNQNQWSYSVSNCANSLKDAGHGETRVKCRDIWATETTLQVPAFHVRMILGPDLT